MQQTLFYLSNLIIVGYLAFIIGKQLYESNKLKNWQQEAQAEFETANYEMNAVRRDHLALIGMVYSQQYGKDIAAQLEKRAYFEGMPMILLLTSLGLPDKIQDGMHKGVSISKWYYGESTNRLGNATYELEITVENYKVVGWRDLK